MENRDLTPLSLREPLNRADELALKPRIAPRVLEVPERIVVRTARPVGLRPRERIVSGCADRRRIEPQEHLHARARILAEGVELFVDREPAAKAGCRGVILIFDDDPGAPRPGMFLEICADKAPVLGPFVKRVGRAVHAEEPLPS